MEAYGKAVASIESTDDDKFGPNGGFTAILSTPSLDRDGDRLHRDEWIEPLQDRYPLDIDHGMSVADTIGSFHPYFDGEKMMMDATFASTPKAQEVRALIQEGHISSVSVAFMTDRSKKDSEPRRELLNAGIVAIPSNRDAVILASKAAHALKDAFSDATEGDVPEEVKAAVLEALEAKSPKPYGNVTYADPHNGKYPIDTEEHVRAAWSYINVAKNAAEYSADELAAIKQRIREAAEKFGIKIDGKSLAEVAADALVEIFTKAAAPGGDAALVQAIHDASSHLGAACPVMEPDVDPGSGADDGANKSAEDEADTKDLDAFEKALDEVLTPQSDSPAEEVPAPADEAAAAVSDAADEDVAFELSARALRLRMLATHISN